MLLDEDMTEEEFIQKVGRAPTQDDLERVNCPLAGRIGHQNCGWNFKHNCPMFQRSDE